MNLNQLLIITTTVLTTACFTTEAPTADPDILKMTDLAFSQMSEEEGIKKAFAYYADEDVVRLVEGAEPTVGKEALIKHFSGVDESVVTLSWKPIKAEIAQSADLGYTYGKFYLTLTDSVETTSTGFYVSIWKKQKDGSWKYVLDGGVEGPVE